MRSLEFAGQELQADVARLQLLNERGQLDAAAQPFVLVDDESGVDTGGAQLAGDGLLQLGVM